MLTRNKRLFALLALTVVVLFALSACGGAVEEPVEEEEMEEEAAPAEEEEMEEEEMEEEEMMPEIGSEDHPIQVLFVPSVEGDVIVAGGEVMAAGLNEATGLNFEVSVPTSYAATIEAMCASPDDTIGFIPALGYVIANNRCGVEVGAAAVRRGLSWYATAYFVPADSEAETLDDLEGATWAYPDPGSTSGFLYPTSEFGSAGVETGGGVEAGGHPQAVLAVYNGEADVGTAFFSPPSRPADEAWSGRDWDSDFGWDSAAGLTPEPWDVDSSECFVDEEDHLICGEYRVLDARQLVTDTAPDVAEKVRILTLSSKIPNDTMSFGPEFPADLRVQIVDALVAFAASDACLESICHEDFYDWSGLEATDDSAYDPVRNLIDVIGMSEEDILG
jgi:phosphonate transport system substrate-binding protein